jgi:hypothetical protein
MGRNRRSQRLWPRSTCLDVGNYLREILLDQTTKWACRRNPGFKAPGGSPNLVQVVGVAQPERTSRLEPLLDLFLGQQRSLGAKQEFCFVLGRSNRDRKLPIGAHESRDRARSAVANVRHALAVNMKTRHVLAHR